MRAGLALSAILHGGLIAYGLAWLELPRPLDAESLEAIPVSFVEIAPETSLPKAAPPPAPKPVPAPQVLPLPDLPPLPQPAAEAPPPPTPSPPEVAAATPEPPQPAARLALDADALAALATPPVPPVPRARPAVPKPPQPKDEPFDIDRITAVLDRQQAEAATPPATAGGSDTPDSTASIGALIGASQPRMTLSEIEALRSRLAGCWRQPAGWSDPAEIRVVLIIALNRDGTVARPPEVVEAPAGRYQQVAAESARRAVYECAPYNLPVAKYEDWRELKMTFDPTAAGGAG